MSEQLKASIARILLNGRDTTVGVGFLVLDKYVLTCAHVVMQALGLKDTSSLPKADLRLDFPFVAPGRPLNARLVCWQSSYEEDTAVLELESFPPATAHPVRFVDEEELWGHSFRAFGFPIDYDKGVWASGVLRQGQVGGWIQIEATNVPGHRVVQGFSGTPVWDEQLDGVVGMVVESDRQAPTKAAYIIPTALLVKAWPNLSQQTIPPCPYRGLFAFREVDEPYFFGREIYVAQLIEAVQKKSFTAIIGPSGCGKSSVVFAGLVPQLSRSGNWIVASFRPGSQPFCTLASALIPFLEANMSETDRLVEINKLAKLLQSGELTLMEVMEHIVHKQFDTHLLLVVNQFEELYTLCSSEDERQHFLDVLLSIIQPATYRRLLNFRLVITLRADFCGHAFSYRPLADALQHADLKLGPMVRHELRDAIRKPSEKLKVRVDEELIERILGTVSKEPGYLPLLEFALTLLWKRQRGSRLTLAAYDEIGGVEAALAVYADEVYERLSKEEQVQVQQIFIQLAHPGEGTEDTRRIATRAEIGEKCWTLVPLLSDARLVVSGRDESTGNETVEVVHEALIRGWKRLCDWMELEREFRLWQERLRIAIRQWENMARDPGAFLHGALLGEALDWLSQHASTLSKAEQVFIRSSWEEERREQEHLHALLEESERQRQIALARGLAAQSELLYTHHPRLLEQSCLLAVEAMLRFPSLEANQAMRKSIGLLRCRLVTLHHEGSVIAVAFSSDGLRLATGSDDGTATLWDIAKGERLVTMNYENSVIAVAFSSDGLRLATGSDDGTATLWDIAKGERLVTLHHNRKVEVVVFSPNGRHLATGSDDGTATLWDIAKGERLITMNYENSVIAVAFSPNGRHLATGSDDGTVTLWDIAKGERLVTLHHEEAVQSIAFSPDGHSLATASMDDTAVLWTTSGKRLAILCHEEEVQAVTFSPDGHYLVTACNDCTTVLWDVLGKGHLATLCHEDFVGGVAFSPDGHFVATISQDKTAALWETTSGKRLTILHHNKAVETMAFSPDGSYLATACNDHTAILWDTTNGKRLATLQHEGWVRAVAFSPDGSYLATACNDHTAILWDTTNGKRLATLQHEGWVRAVAFSPDGSYLATSSVGDSVTLWDVARSERRVVLRQEGLVEAIAFSPDGYYLATASWGSTVVLWNVERGERSIILQHSSAVRAVAFSADGHIIVTASMDGTAVLWDRVTGRRLVTLQHEGSVGAVAFSPDGHFVATASQDKTAALWDRVTGRRLATLQHEGSVGAVAFSPDGHFVATASQDKTATLWLWQPEDLIAEAQIRIRRNLTLGEWQQYIGDEPYHKTFPYLP